MDTIKPKESDIFLGEFKNKLLENEYFSNEIREAMVYIKPMVLVLGLLYLLFIIPDYFLISNPNTFIIILLNRIIFFFLVVLLYFRLNYLDRLELLAYWFTAYKLILAVTFLFIFYQYENPNFLIQSFGVMAIITAIYMVPNRWIFKVALSFLISGAFFFLSFAYLDNVSVNEFSASLVYILLVIALNSISSYRFNYYKRMKYLYSKELLQQSITDPLSGIFNRQKFNMELSHWIDISKENKSPLSLVLFDIDNFKLVNDQYGHLMGDKIIVKFSDIVIQNIRKNDIFARWGGDEFVILLPDTTKKDAVELMTRIQKAINERNLISGLISCSMGIETLKPGDSIDSFLQRADEKLYEAKANGKNIIVA